MSATTKSPYDIVIRPIVTEKSMRGQTQNKYTFAVLTVANKFEIAWAIRTLQMEINNPIDVVSVNTIVIKGKSRRGRFFKRANQGHTKNWKKAIVTLRPHQQIEMVEGV